MTDTRALESGFLRSRQRTMQLCEPLSAEDHLPQAMVDVSPPKWHLAHTTWFFEALIVRVFGRSSEPFDEGFDHLFNSYYHSLGERLARAERGLLSRPGLERVREYRRVVEERMVELLDDPPAAHRDEIHRRTEIGIHHEQQHQELLLTDLKYNFFRNPQFPAYATSRHESEKGRGSPMRFLCLEGGTSEIGASRAEFSFDNEHPRHAVSLIPFELADRLVTNAEYLEFVEDGGYRNPLLWLDDGWAIAERDGWSAPLYWLEQDGERHEFTLFGVRDLVPDDPACHLSFYEADAFARWKGARLPTEAEWEHAAASFGLDSSEGRFQEDGDLHPRASDESRTTRPRQFFGTCWEHTGTAYRPHPGYRAEEGALGEYNAKFMSNQMVCKGGSIATPRDHIRASYRNFFHPEKRWQFLGVRLARDV